MYNGFAYETKIGKISIVENGRAITSLYFGGFTQKNIKINETFLLKKAAKQLQEYLDGKRKDFNLPLEPTGSEFQTRVWKALCEIPYGKTVSYKDIAEKVGNPKACRAVGMANNKNPIPIFIPCHRVVGTNGKLTGYAGGIELKSQLLKIESGFATF